MHWSKTQSNIALSSAEAELNATVKGLSELIGVYNLVQETLRVNASLALYTDASACKGMLLRHGSGKVKHLSVKQLWSQEAVKLYDVQVCRVPREANPSDMLTHSVTFPAAEKQLACLKFFRGKLGQDRHGHRVIATPEGTEVSRAGSSCAHSFPVDAVYAQSLCTVAQSEEGCRRPHPLRTLSNLHVPASTSRGILNPHLVPSGKCQLHPHSQACISRRNLRCMHWVHSLGWGGYRRGIPVAILAQAIEGKIA